MNSILILLISLLLVTAEDDPSVSMKGVTDLTSETFDNFVDGSKFAIVEFYAPWCGHCKHLAPDYKKLGAAVAEDPILSSKVVVGKVNADSDRKLGERFGVSGFPTLKYFVRGDTTAKDYDGGRSFKDLLEFVQKQVEGDSVGRLDEFEDVVQKFVGGKKEEALKECEELLSKTKGGDIEYAEYYFNVMKKTIEKGDDYPKNEKERLNRMVKSKSLKNDKIKTFVARINILSVFSPDE